MLAKGLLKCFWLLSGFFIQGCGEGAVTAPIENITGTYSLEAVTVKYSNGATITEKDISVSGTMKIGTDTLRQSLVINNTPVTVGGHYSITYSRGTNAGILHITESSRTSDISFSISDNILTTYSGVVSLESGLTFEEWDVWEKISDLN